MKKKSTITLLIIILILAATAGISFAAFSYAQNGTNENSIEIGDITFKYTEKNSKGNGIDIEDAFPISDAEGKILTDYFDFKIESNLSRSDLLYEVVIEPTEESTINLDGVKVYITELDNNTEKDINSNYDINDKIKTISDYSNGIIYQERILKNTRNYEKHFRVRIWISEDIDWSEEGYIGEKGSFRINVNARSNQSMVDASLPTPVITGGTGLTKVYEPQTIRLANNPEIGGVDHYEYYITDDENDIPTEETIATGQTQGELLIDQMKPKYIYYRLVTNDNKKSAWSNVEIVNYGVLCELEAGTIVKEAGYTGAADSFKVPCDGNYKVELWGAQGGKAICNGSSCAINANGGYTSGNIELTESDNLYLYVGSAGQNGQIGRNAKGGYNGGGLGTSDGSTSDGPEASGAGGGATDIRINNGEWNDQISLNSRIMVAGAGGGSSYNYYGGVAGGLTGYSNYSVSVGGSQISGFEFGRGKDASGVADSDGVGGGAGGYYGGTTSNTARKSAGAGGSSYISGHTGCVAIAEGSTTNPRAIKSGCNSSSTSLECSIHYSGLYFTNTNMIDGKGHTWTTSDQGVKSDNLMPNPNGGYYSSGAGHTGNGYARITYLGN